MRFAPAIFANSFFLLAVIGYGSILRPLFPHRLSRADRIALILLGGIGMFGTVLFLIGQIRLSRTIIVITLLPAFWGAALVLRAVRVPFRHMLRLRPPLVPATIVAVVLLLVGVAGMAAPTGDISTPGLKNDSIAYHFLGPRVWLRNEAIRPVPDECLTAMPALVETGYCALISIGGARAPGLFAVVQLGILLLISAGLALRLGLQAREIWWAAALIAAMPVVIFALTRGYVDAIYSALILAALRLAPDLNSRCSWVLFGILGGFAMATKYTGIIAFILLALCVFAASRIVLKSPFLRTWMGFALASVVAVCVAAPWYIRNWILLGSPIYPAPLSFLRLFHIRYMSEAAIRALQAEVWREGNGMGRSIWDLLLLPFHLTMHAANFLNGAGGIGLVPLAMAPFAVVVYRRNALAALAGGFAAVQVFAWFVSEQDGRFLIHVLVLAIIAGVVGWRYVGRVSPRYGRALAALAVALSVSYGLFMIGRSREESVHAVFSKSFEEQRMQAEIPFLDSFVYLNEHSAVQKVLFLNPNVPAFYSQKDYLKPFGRWGEQVLPDVRTVQEALGAARSLHVSDILDVRWPGGSFDVPQKTPGLVLIFGEQDQRIYRVNYAAASAGR